MMDNWKHRSSRMSCFTCMWWVEKQKMADAAMTLEEHELSVVKPKLGRCRRHAPTMSGFPAVFDGDWCGDHKIDENKA